MPRKEIREKQERAILLQKVPEGATRIQVLTEKGSLKYKALDALADTDIIQVTKDGDPVVMFGKPGRKPNIKVAPANDVVAEILKRKEEALKEDPVLKVVRVNPESADVLQQVIVGLTEEAASLGFERKEAERRGVETLNVSSKRIQALRAVGETWLKRQEQMTERSIDLDSPGFKVLFRFILDTFREAMNAAGLRSEQADTVYAKLHTMLDEEWENEARNRMKKPF